MSIDVHNHAIPTEALDLLESDPSFGVRIDGDQWSGGSHVPFPIHPSFHDPAAKLAYMDERRVGGALVSPAPPLFFYEATSGDAVRLCEAVNDGLAKFCSHAPERLDWLANLPMQDPDAAVATYRAAAAAGARGAAVGTSIAGVRLDGPGFEPFWRAADELGLPVLVHPAFNERHAALESFYLQNVVGNPLETTLTVERLICSGVLTRHPNVRLILMHGGGFLPYQAGRLLHACGVRQEITLGAEEIRAAFDQLYFDTIVHDEAALRFLVDKVGLEHVLLGTDMPFDMGEDRPMDRLEAALDAKEIETVTESNVERLLAPRDVHRRA